jgi:hypothetical protein
LAVHGSPHPDAYRFLERFHAFASAASVERYLALFAEDATLLDAGMSTPLTRAELGPTIAAVLTALENFRFSFRCVAADGHEVFVEAFNEATLAGRALSWRAAYCVTLTGDLVHRGRRTYDQWTVFSAGADAGRHPLHLQASGLAPSADLAQGRRPGGAGPAGARAVFADRARRRRAWEEGDVAVLLAGIGDRPLLGPGLETPIDGDDRRRWLEALFALASLRLEAGVTVGDSTAAFQEWSGTAVAMAGSAERPFRLVEGIRAEAGGEPVWVLFFDTWHLTHDDTADGGRLRQVHDLTSGPSGDQAVAP